MKARFNGKSLRIFKPNRDKKGAASAFQIVKYKNKKDRWRCVIFLDMAPEVPSENEFAKFAWQDKNLSVTVQLDDLDVAEMLLVLYGNKGGAGPEKDGKSKGLYHNNPKGNTVINFARNERGQIFLGLSSKRGEQNVRVSHVISDSEAILLTELFKNYLSVKYATLSSQPQ